jgi:predicted nucleotidyltransferase
MTIATPVHLTHPHFSILTKCGDIEAAAVYGSVARGDVETHSDTDLLLVCSTRPKAALLNEVREALKSHSKNLSITIYSRRDLYFLNANKSLFLLHLSREAIPIFDRTGFFTNLLTNFHPKASYKADFEKSLSLIDPLRTLVRLAPNNMHRLSYTYSLFRVFGVYLLAQQGIYEFSKARMVDALSEKFPELGRHVRALANLRALNSSFFTGGCPSELGVLLPSAAESVNSLAAISGRSIQVQTTTYENAVSEFESAVGGRSRGLDYRLRMWFLLLAYDGFNQYCIKEGKPQLRDLAENSLLELTNSDEPDPIARAAWETIRYIHRYPLKYFLNEDSRISSGIASHLLRELSDVLTA